MLADNDIIARLEGYCAAAEHDTLAGDALAAIKELTAWQEKVCAIIQPAETPDEWGADVADIIAWREQERRSLREVVAAREVEHDHA